MWNNGFQNMNAYGNMQPFGYAANNYSLPQTNTNKLYVSGIEDVRQRQMPNGSDFIFLDNDKPILYQKIVDSTGQFEIKTFSIAPYLPQDEPKPSQSIDLSSYAKTSDLEPIKAELQAIKDKLSGGINGNGKEKL